MTYSERTMRLMDSVLRGDSVSEQAVDGGWPSIDETCCGKCPGGSCYVDFLTGERS